MRSGDCIGPNFLATYCVMTVIGAGVLRLPTNFLKFIQTSRPKIKEKIVKKLHVKSFMGAISGKTAYESSVILRAVDRAGKNTQLKGHIHEILVKDAKAV